jgi:diguanylate cyclase (GGDEF)-like protein
MGIRSKLVILVSGLVALTSLGVAVGMTAAGIRGAHLLVPAGLGGVLSAGLLAALFQRVLRPVRTLRRVARAMADGHLDVRVPELGRGGLGELGETFNKMAAALQAQHDNLEQVVAERTRELREANLRLERLATTDGLTGVYNHRRFQEALAQETLRSGRNGRPFSVLFLDVDHFKRFNDAMGHPAGDELLRQLAALLARELRSSDLVARYGGEEFGVILADTGKDRALQVAERLRAAVELELNDTARAPYVTVSVGAATYGFDGETPRQLVGAADRALYVAKHTGRNRVAAADESMLQRAG